MKLTTLLTVSSAFTVGALLIAACSGDDDSPPAQMTPTAAEASQTVTIRRSALKGLDTFAFVAQDAQGRSDVYVMDARGRAKNVTPGAGNELDVDLSPDGRRIAFTSDREGSPDIFVANADGSGVRRLTDLPTIENTPSWSPDGRKIAFGLGTADESRFALYLVNADGGDVLKLFEKDGCYAGDPAWSPDGATIAFGVDCAGGGEVDVWAMNADGSNVRQLTHASGDDGAAVWSPDGGRIAFHSDRGPALYTMKPDGSDQRQVGPVLAFEDADVAWSQDAKMLLYVSGSGGDVYALGVDGGKPVQVTTGVLVSDVSTAAPPTQTTETTAPDFQVNRSALAGLGKLAFVATVDGQVDLYVLHQDGRVENLTNDPASEGEPAWSPDGKRIAYASDGDLMVADADGARARRLTDLPTSEGTPSWSPDGTKIVFHLETLDETRFALYIVGADGGHATKLFERGSDCNVEGPDWSPDGRTIVFTGICAAPGGGLSIINSDGTGLRRLTGPGVDDGSPEWARDGSVLAFSRDDPPRIYTVEPDGSNLGRIKADLPFQPSLDWSAAGDKLVLVNYYGGDMYVADLKGGKPVQLTTGLLVSEGVSVAAE